VGGLEEMRREENENFLRTARVGRISTSLKDQPYIVPIFYVYHKGRILIHTSGSGKKIEAIAKNSAVCFEIDESSEDERKLKSVIVFGKASIIQSGEEKLEALRALVEKYREYHKSREELMHVLYDEKYYADCMERAAIIAISPTQITGRKRER